MSEKSIPKLECLTLLAGNHTKKMDIAITIKDTTLMVPKFRKEYGLVANNRDSMQNHAKQANSTFQLNGRTRRLRLTLLRNY